VGADNSVTAVDLVCSAGRPGHDKRTITDLSGLALGERPNTAIIRQRVSGNRVVRRNPADVSDC